MPLLAAVALASAAGAAAAQSSPADVVRAWSARLDARDYDGIAKLFAPGAFWAQGGVVFRIRGAADAKKLSALLPCAGRVSAISVQGERATATFVLANFPGRTTCRSVGQKAAALFLVHNGLIVVWQQVAVPAAPKSDSRAA